MPDPEISIIIPVLNGAPWIGDLLTALQHQSGVVQPYEIIVADNGSTDGTPAIVSHFPVRLLVEAGRKGPAVGRNLGLQAARGAWIANLDADTLPTRAWLAALMRPLADPAVTLVGGVTHSYLPQTPAAVFMAHFAVHAFEYATGRDLFPFRSSRNLAYRRAQALAIGGWAEDMPTAEDMDFCYRLVRRFPGTQAQALDAVVFHRDRADDQALRRQAWTYGEGLAHMYLRYPQAARWGGGRTLQLAGVLLWRSLLCQWLRLAQRIRPTHAARLAHAQYHSMWSWAYWRGFWSMYHRKVRTPPPWEERSHDRQNPYLAGR